jgi:glycerate kinase
MMKVLIATDSFKDALTAQAVGEAIEKGFHLANPNVQTTVLPLADGGEGTLQVLMAHQSCTMQHLEVLDPLFRPIEGYYALSEDRQTAFIEMAVASGLELLTSDERNPLKTSTLGTGQLLLDAIQKGVTKIFLGIGGSATNDVGMGMAKALGYRFLDSQGYELSPIGENLSQVRKIDGSQCQHRVALQTRQIEVKIICDVNNPLYGASGAAYVYAAQKGATSAMIEQLDMGSQHFGNLLHQQFNRDFSSQLGAGAAGGMGAGCAAFLNASLHSGIALILQHIGFEEHLKQANLLITGEGKLDHQTQSGKLIKGLTQMAEKYSVPVIALCGALEANPDEIKALGLKAAFCIQTKPVDLFQALQETAINLTHTAFNIAQIWFRN